MEPTQDFNPELKEEISKVFAELYKEIGNNRQQLANKVLSLHKEINKELNKSKVDDNRKKEILNEVSRIVKMAGQQLPHLRMNQPKPGAMTPPKPPIPAPKPKTPPAEKKIPPAKKAEPQVKKAAAPAKKSTPVKKTATPAKKASPKAKKKKK